MEQFFLDCTRESTEIDVLVKRDFGVYDSSRSAFVDDDDEDDNDGDDGVIC